MPRIVTAAKLRTRSDRARASRKRGRPQAATEPARRAAVAQSANNTINYDAAVREGKQIAAEKERLWWRLCELADRTETRYGEQTLERFAKDIGEVPCTFLRRMSVYAAWKSAPGPKSDLPCFAVARELQSHPDRYEIIKNNPNVTKREASKLARQWREQGDDRDDKPPDWGLQQTAGWFKELYNLATKVIEQAQITNADVSQQLLREVVEPMEAWLPTLREAGEACIKLANDLELLLKQERWEPPAEAAE